jgi:hypothetical protein
MDISFDPNLSYNKGLTYHSFIYFSFGALYLALGCNWIFAWIKNYAIVQQLPLFLAISLLGALTLMDELLSGTTVLLMEITDGLFVNLFLFASNLLTLWNIAGLYMILMLSSKGWCISRPIISNAEKQFTILIGSSMMLVEVILLGSTHVYAIGLVIAYLFIARLFKMEIAKVLRELDRQISSFEVFLI